MSFKIRKMQKFFYKTGKKFHYIDNKMYTNRLLHNTSLSLHGANDDTSTQSMLFPLSVSVTGHVIIIVISTSHQPAQQQCKQPRDISRRLPWWYGGAPLASLISCLLSSMRDVDLSRSHEGPDQHMHLTSLGPVYLCSSLLQLTLPLHYKTCCFHRMDIYTVIFSHHTQGNYSMWSSWFLGVVRGERRPFRSYSSPFVDSSGTNIYEFPSQETTQCTIKATQIPSLSIRRVDLASITVGGCSL